ncbi:MAG: hypothetical protein RLN86_12505 [Cyclobacteriaceae bacterium]
MTQYLTLITLFFTLSTSVTFSQNAAERSTLLKELDFLIGTWDVTMEWYDTHKPGSERLFIETGQQTCAYDFYQDGLPMFITCRGEVTSDRGRRRTIQESIRFGKFSGTYERTGLYSNWPATGKELLYFDSDNHKFVIYGELDVQDNMLERYEDIYKFDDNYSSFTRKNVANFSDMPITQFNLTMIGIGKKVR